ncbi:MAG: NTP transferase domain-containing protein [Synergistaceae bacterium]|jgi:CTP:molybdopterin cytidylyltransferase MocA|nr:NTP transferase domain-containing protein [Synergistaceae bacterium]
MKKNDKRRITGIILAGGASKRMGECKALLPAAAESSALETIVTRMRSPVVSDIIVVTGGYRGKITKEAKRLKCQTVFNPEHKSGMYSSLLAGVRALPSDAEAFFVLPVDTPLVKPFTYASLIEAFYEGYGSPDVVYPTFMGRRGHPPLIGRTMIEPILSWSGEGGLRGLLSNCPCKAMDLQTGDRSVTLDMDTKIDHERLLEYAKSEFFPDADECSELLRIAETPTRVVMHARVVARCAALIMGALAKGGVKINGKLLASACLLHDLAKGKKNHEARGAQWLRNRGYGKVAKIVASHKDLIPNKHIGEAEILYLADKITDGETVSSISARMVRVEARFPAGSEALDNARRRLLHAADIQRKVESVVGAALDKILSSL